MPVKESSDELNPTVITTDPVIEAPRPARTGKDYLALTIATGGGAGYLPIAPGTWGSLVAIVVYILVRGATMKLFFGPASPSTHDLFRVYYAVLTVELFAVSALALGGTWAASRTEKLSGKKDPGKVVIDEVVGQFIALLPVPFLAEPAWWAVILAFFVFRFFDIVKPYPARTVESFHGGLGIMGDDLIAGFYAGLVVMVAVCASWFI